MNEIDVEPVAPTIVNTNANDLTVMAATYPTAKSRVVNTLNVAADNGTTGASKTGRALEDSPDNKGSVSDAAMGR